MLGGIESEAWEQIQDCNIHLMCLYAKFNLLGTTWTDSKGNRTVSDHELTLLKMLADCFETPDYQATTSM